MLRVLSLCSIILLFVGSDAIRADDLRKNELRLQVGKWVAIKKSESKSTGGRAIPKTQKIYRQGPEDKEPIQLFEQTSTGSVSFNLRDDGVLLVLPIGEKVRLYFPKSKDPVEFDFPPPQKWTKKYQPYTDAEQTWFLDDILFFDGDVCPGHRLLGYVRIDSKRQTVGEGKLCIEVAEREQAIARAARAWPVVFRMDDTIFWVNAGYHNIFHPDVVKGEWKPHKIRAISIKKGDLIDPEKIPEELLQKHAKRLLDFLEKEAHNRCGMFELWAISILGKFGDAKDIPRLRALSKTVSNNHIEVEPDKIANGDKTIQEAYSKAIELLEKNR
jgi:hypothetical protein